MKSVPENSKQENEKAFISQRFSDKTIKDS